MLTWNTRNGEARASLGHLWQLYVLTEFTKLDGYATAAMVSRKDSPFANCRCDDCDAGHLELRVEIQVEANAPPRIEAA